MLQLDAIEWVETLTLGPPTPSKEENRVESKEFHHWKGVGWNTHVIIQNKKHNHHSIGLFLGFSCTDKLPKDWSQHIKCQYTLLADDGSPLYECKEIRYHFKNDSVVHERVGSINVVDFEGLCDLCHHYSTTNTNFRVHTVIEEIPAHTVNKRRLSVRRTSSEWTGESDKESVSERDEEQEEIGDEEVEQEERDRSHNIERLSKILASPTTPVGAKAHAAKQLRRCLDAY